MRKQSSAVTVLAMIGFFTAGAAAQETPEPQSADAFGSRIGLESIGLYSESLVRGFNLQEAGNYRVEDAFFVRAAAPSDVILQSLQVRVGPSALDLDYPAPSGVVAYRLLPGDRNRSSIELGFQHALDSNPRPYSRAFATRRFFEDRASLSVGWIAAETARYIYGNEARYQGLGIVPRVELGERWQLTMYASRYDQRFQADCGFLPTEGAMPIEPDRLRYLGQPWSRFDTHNSNHGAILSSRPRAEAWNFRFSSLVSDVDRPRSDFNMFRDVAADGSAEAVTIIARDRRITSWAHEAIAARESTFGDHRLGLNVVARYRDSDYRDPITQTVELGRVSLFDRPRIIEEPVAPAEPTRTSAHVRQTETGASLRYAHRTGLAANVSARRVFVDENSKATDRADSARSSANWLYNASLAVPITDALTAFVATTRGIEEAGTAPQNAANRFEVLSPVLAVQSEVGVQWRPHERLRLIATLFDIEKPEPGFDSHNVYRYLTTVTHRGIEASISAQLTERLNVLVGGAWLEPELQGAAVAAGLRGDRPVGRSAEIALASFKYEMPWPQGLSIDVDATYNGARPTGVDNRFETPAYTLINAGARYEFTMSSIPVAIRFRAYNGSDEYAWYASTSGIQSYEPERRIMLSFTFGE
jgi:iron complex outermembrane recepter protein